MVRRDNEKEGTRSRGDRGEERGRKGWEEREEVYDLDCGVGVGLSGD